MDALPHLLALAGFLGTGPFVVWLADGLAGRRRRAIFPRL